MSGTLARRCMGGFLAWSLAASLPGCAWLNLGKSEPEQVSDVPAGRDWSVPGAVVQRGDGLDGSDESDGAGGAGAASITLRMHFDVLRVDLPVNEIRHSLKIWNHLDESIGDPGQTALLARNGFRIGVGDPSVWPALRAIFEDNGGRSTRADRVVQDGLGLVIPLGEVSDGDTYFLHRRNGELQGGTFRAGTKQLVLDYAPDDTDPRWTKLTITPETRDREMRRRLVDRGGQVTTIRDFDGLVFNELSATVTLKPGQFLVIGNSVRGGQGYLLGSWWLNLRMEKQDFETVLCINAQTKRVE